MLCWLQTVQQCGKAEEWRRVIFSWFFISQATRVAVCPNMATCKCQFSLHLQAKSFVLAAGRKFPSSFCCRQRKLSAARSEHKQLQLVLLPLMVQLQLQLVSPDFADTCYAGPSSMCNINKGQLRVKRICCTPKFSTFPPPSLSSELSLWGEGGGN